MECTVLISTRNFWNKFSLALPKLELMLGPCFIYSNGKIVFVLAGRIAFLSNDMETVEM